MFLRHGKKSDFNSGKFFTIQHAFPLWQGIFQSIRTSVYRHLRDRLIETGIAAAICVTPAGMFPLVRATNVPYLIQLPQKPLRLGKTKNPFPDEELSCADTLTQRQPRWIVDT